MSNTIWSIKHRSVFCLIHGTGLEKGSSLQHQSATNLPDKFTFATCKAIKQKRSLSYFGIFISI